MCQNCRNFARVAMFDTRANRYFLGASFVPDRFRLVECNSQQVKAHLMSSYWSSYWSLFVTRYPCDVGAQLRERGEMEANYKSLGSLKKVQ